MPIDTNTAEGKDFDELAQLLFKRHARLERLDRYSKGDPPLPEGIGTLRDAARDYFKTSRTNFAELVAEAPRERMKPIGMRTAAADGEAGDTIAWQAWTSAGLPVLSADVHQAMLSLGDGYVIVSWDAKNGRPVVTAEDSRQVVTLHDPMTGEIRLAMKLYRDQAAKMDRAYVYRPGQVLVAERVAKELVGASVLAYNANDWDWNQELSAPLPAGFEDVIPVVRFKNRGDAADDLGGGCGEFERHIDILDRINRTILRGMVIMTYQAFKQRAVEGNLPERDDEGNLIDYAELFKAGPDALWLLPPDAKIWESGQVDLTPILSFVKSDVLFLAAVTRTPLAMLTPDAATQSAEGASLQREGLVFKTEDRIARATHAWAQVMALIFRFKGDTQRAAAEQIQLIWAPVERNSLGEIGSAVSQTKGVLSRYQQLTTIVGMTPDQAAQNLTELTDDLLLDQQYAAALKALNGQTTNVTNNNAA